MADIKPLSTSQIQFLQHLASVHVTSRDKAQLIWDDINSHVGSPQTDNELGRNLDETLSQINRSLKPGFNMEIRAVSLANADAPPAIPTDSDGVPIASSSSRTSQSRTQFYAIVNCVADDVSKASAYPLFCKNGQNLEYFRLVLSHFIESVATETSSQDSPNLRGAGCPSSLSRIDLINARNELPSALKSKLPINQAEKMLKIMELEGWLVPNNNNQNNSRRRSSTGSSNALQIGPRTYMELSDFLVDLGLERDYLPQILLI